MSVAWVGAGIAAVGVVSNASAAGKGAKAQNRATDAANAEQARQFDNNAALQAPAINTGNAARDRLSYLLGLSPTGYGSTTSVGDVGNKSTGGAPALTYDALREQLLGQYTRSTGSNAAGPAVDPLDSRALLGQQSASDPYTDPSNWREVQISSGQGGAERIYTGPTVGSEVDEAGLDTAIRQRLAEQDAATKKAQTDALAAAQADPDYGRLAQQFEFQTYTPDKYVAPEAYVADKFSYTGQDLYDDPSYKFRLDQGQKALDRQGAASGRFLSGSQLQASSNYNQGAASQEYQSAYNRALGTFSTNEGNRAQAYNTNTTNGLNAFNVNSTNKFNAFNTNETNRFNANQANYNNTVNPLLSLAGSAQTASGYLGGAGQQTAQIMGNNLTANANAQGAAGIATANGINNGLSNAVGGYQSNQLMNSLLNRNTSVNNNPYMAGSTPAYGNNNYWSSGTSGMGD